MTNQTVEFEILLIAPDGFSHPEGNRAIETIERTHGAWAVLRFEQGGLPRLLERMGVDVLLMPYWAAPLRSPVPTMVLNLINLENPSGGLGARLLKAARAAGVQGALSRYTFSDLHPQVTSHEPGAILEPWVHSSFRGLSQPADREIASRHDLPHSYVLAHGVSLQDIPLLAAAWTWVDGSVGDNVPLAVITSSGEELSRWRHEIRRMSVAHSVRLLDAVQFNELAGLYRRAEVMLSGGQGVQQQVLRWSLAVGMPVAAFDIPLTGSVLGPAGYLVEAGDTRALGAACLTMLVEPEVQDRLKKAALLRASAYHQSRSSDVLRERLLSAASG